MKKAFVFILMLFISLFSCSNKEDEKSILETELYPKSIYIAVFGDLQYLTNRNHIDIYEHSLNWILSENKRGRNFNCILHTGDVTENNYLDQWDSFFEATLPIANHIPFYTLIGNHDYSWVEGHIVDRYSTLFNDYVKFPLSCKMIVAAYEEGRMENIVVKNEIYGQRYDILLLEFGPRDEVVEWAKQWISSHHDIKYIVMNHEYLEKGGGRRTTGLKCQSQLRNTSYKTPVELWDELIRCHDNIVCVLCGHVGGLYAVTYDINDFGREVCQIQHNIQGSEYRYDNWIMVWEFPMNSDSASVSIINTKNGHYYNNKQCLFKFQYRYDMVVDRVTYSITN